MTRENNHQIVSCEQREKISWATINHSLTLAVIRQLSELFSRLRSDAEVRVVILKMGVDGSSGSASELTDLSLLTPDQAVEYARAGQALTGQIEDLGKPVIAALDGRVLGGELELALACAWRMATEEFALAEAASGLLPGFGGLTRLPRLIGKSRALDLILTGEPIDGRAALRIGLIDRLTHDLGELNSVCAELARQISRRAPLAIKYALEAVNRGSEVSLAEGLRLESALFAMCFATEDVKEGTQAFLEKRAPLFKAK